MRPYSGDQPLTYWVLDDPAVTAQYRAIIRDLAANVFTHTALMNMVDSLEKVVIGRGASPRAHLANRAAQLQQLVAGWGGK